MRESDRKIDAGSVGQFTTTRWSQVIAAGQSQTPESKQAFAMTLLFFMGMGGGFYIVPLQAFLQVRAPEENRGKLIATSNFLSFCGVALASGFLFFLEKLEVSPDWSFFITGILTLGLTIFVIRLLPDFLLRFIGLIITRLVYHLNIVRIENVPIEGGALLVLNHISYIDALLLGSTQQRRIRFVMSREHFENSRFNWFYRLMQVIPISNSEPPKRIVRALEQARTAMDEGYLVCISAEGAVTEKRFTDEFKLELERTYKDADYPAIPVAIHGIRDSIDGASRKQRAKIRRRITVAFGDLFPATVDPFPILGRCNKDTGTPQEKAAR